MQSYTLTDYRPGKREPVIALGSHQPGPQFLHPRYLNAGPEFKITNKTQNVAKIEDARTTYNQTVDDNDMKITALVGTLEIHTA